MSRAQMNEASVRLGRTRCPQSRKPDQPPVYRTPSFTGNTRISMMPSQKLGIDWLRSVEAMSAWS